MTAIGRAIQSRLRRLLGAARTWLRTHLPEPAVRLLKRLRDTPAELQRLRSSTERARLQAAREEFEWLGERPLISLVMPTYKPELGYLGEAIESVRAQIYPEWELRIVDDGSGDPELTRFLREQAAAEPRIKPDALPRNGGISAATNLGLRAAEGEFVAFLDHDDTLTPDALLRVAQALDTDPEIDVVYSDSDKLDGHGRRVDPFLKPDWSPVYALGAMYIGHLLVVRRSLAEAAGGFDSAFDKIQDFEFMMRVSERAGRIHHIPRILYHWRAIPGSIAAGAEEKSGVPALQARAVSEHLERIGAQARAVPHPSIPHRAVLAPRASAPTAELSVVVAARRADRNLDRLLDSLRRGERGAAETIVVLPAGEAAGERAGVTWLQAPATFHRAVANNLGAAAAGAEHLLFLDGDCEVLDEDWVVQLLLHAELPGVGAVGPMVVGLDGRIERAGVAIGLDEPALPIAAGAGSDEDGYYGALPCAREVSAASATALAVRRAEFSAVGGFSEFYSSEYEDYDLCQRLAARGLATVYSPRPRILTRRAPAARRDARDIVDRALFVDSWFDELVRGDPYFNPNFGRRRADYSAAGWRELLRPAVTGAARR